MMVRRWPPTLVALVPLLICQTGAWPASPTITPGAAAADAALQQALNGLVGMQRGPPGAIAIVQRGRERRIFTAGTANIASGRRLRAFDPMRLASTSKAYNGAAALSLVNQGLLSLDDTIGARLPELPQDWSQVTLRQLLNHTSGLPNYLESPSFQRRIANRPLKPEPPDQLLTYVYGRTLKFPPGTRYAYSNSDNVAVGLMIERVALQPYEQVLAERIYTPLELTKTSLPAGFRMPRPFIHGYELVPSNVPEDVSQIISSSFAWASGGMVSTPAELNRFIRGLLGRRLFDRAVQNQQLRFIERARSEPPGPGRNAAGLGIFRYRTRCGTVYGHTGNYFGYTQFMAAARGGRRSTTVSVNLQLRPDIDSVVFAALRETETLAVCAALAENP